MRQATRAVRALIGGVIMVAAGLCATAADPAATTITTPHWQWPAELPAIRAVFIVNSAATREPDELAQRFPIHATTVPVRGDDYGNAYDEDALLAALRSQPDVLVIAATKVWRDLSPDATSAITESVRNGLQLIVLQRNPSDAVLPDLTPVDATPPLPDDAMRRHVFRRGADTSATVYALGDGRVTVLGGYDLHWTFHAAFLPQHDTFADFPVAAELAYTQLARVLYWATGKLATDVPETAATSRWYSPYGDQIRGARVGTTVRQWWAIDGTRFAFGAEVRETPGHRPIAYTQLTATGVTWTPRDTGVIVLRLVGPDGRLLLQDSWPATSGRGTIAPRTLVTQTCTARLTWEADDTVLDEQRLLLTLSGSVEEMPVIVWGRQTGGLAERWQYKRLRDMGINTLAPVGKKPEIAVAAAEMGMRLVPTNVHVPSDRTMADLDAATAGLAAYADAVAPLQPLGWSLADEPSGTDLLAWREGGAAIINARDDAPVGYCGVWLKPPMDLPATLAAMPFLEAYSPRHLYTPNLWLGAERDLIRDFRAPGSLVTAWTHYVGSRDHEPYARTAPWLWLFDGLDGISYFCSTRHFGVLENDLRTAPDGVWFSDELRQLHRGIAAQIRLAERDRGGVRLVYTPENGQAETIALGLNRAGIAYRWISLDALSSGLDAQASLVVIAGVSTLPADAQARLASFVRAGGGVAVLGGGAWGAELRGIDPADLPDADYSGVPATTDTLGLRGRTNGAAGWRVEGATVVSRFATLGIATSPDGAPDFVQALFATPAISRHDLGDGHIWNIAITPDIDTMPALFSELGAQPIPIHVRHADGTPAPATYVYPLAAGPIQLIGVIQDYHRVDPRWQLRDGDMTTAAGIAHGQQRWASAPATLTLPAEAHVYDLRTRRGIGYTRQVPFTLTPGRPDLFAALPYSVDGLKVSGPDTVVAGSDLRLSIELATSAAPGPHVVHLSMDRLSRPINVTLIDGRADLTIPVPRGATGPCVIDIQDTISPHTAQHTVTVTGERPAALPDLVAAAGMQPTSQPSFTAPTPGAWDDWQPPAVTGAVASVSPLDRRQINHGRQAGMEHVVGGFSLRNPLTRWQASYQACNDPKLGLQDPRQAVAPYLPGLGFKQPTAHLWYYNGYITVHLDDFHATGYVLQDIRVVPDPENARVDCEWETPAGSFVLRSTLTPDHLGLFQELIVRPTRRFHTLRVGFRSYPAGFGKEGKPTIQVAPDSRDWAFIGDQNRDRAYGQGSGPGGILVSPIEWTESDLKSLQFSRLVDESARPLTKTLSGAPGPADIMVLNGEAAGDADDLLGELDDLAPPTDKAASDPAQTFPEIRVHWCLWALPDMGNKEAMDYLTAHAAATRDRLRSLYLDPQLPE